MTIATLRPGVIVSSDGPSVLTALGLLQANGGGTLLLEPGVTYAFPEGVAWDPDDGRLTVEARGATINYAGTGYCFNLGRANPVGQTATGVKIYGGTWVGNASATGCFFVSDINRTEFHDLIVREYTASYAWSIWNQSNWTENTTIYNCQSANNLGAINFTPASVSGGTGTESFARTKVHDLGLSGTGAGPMINCRGSVYGSEFFNTHGNVSGSPVIFHLEGGMSGTTIFHTDLEGSAYTLFEYGTFTGNIFKLLGPFVLRSAAVFEFGTRPAFTGYDLPILGHQIYLPTGGSIVMHSPNGTPYQFTVSDLGQPVFTAI